MNWGFNSRSFFHRLQNTTSCLSDFEIGPRGGYNTNCKKRDFFLWPRVWLFSRWELVVIYSSHLCLRQLFSGPHNSKNAVLKLHFSGISKQPGVSAFFCNQDIYIFFSFISSFLKNISSVTWSLVKTTIRSCRKNTKKYKIMTDLVLQPTSCDILFLKWVPYLHQYWLTL